MSPTSSFAGQLFSLTAAANFEIGQARSGVKGPLICSSSSLRLISITWSKYFDQVIEINLSELELHINGPFTPDLAWPISKFAAAVKENNWPAKLEVGLIGSCTNSSYEDISRAASLAKQAVDKGLKTKSEYTITQGSELVRYTVERDGFLGTFEKMGGVVLAN